MKKMKIMEETVVDVIIVGAGPAGIATSACLGLRNVSNIVLEREDCCASLWKKRSYDRIKLHLAKEFCELPHMPFPRDTPRYVPRAGFIRYLDDYVARFGVAPRFDRAVDSASFDAAVGKWCVVAAVGESSDKEVYFAEFLVVATGENGKGFLPWLKGFESFRGIFMHSSKYVNGKEFEGKEVLVVGAGNSGLEIAYDLSNWNVQTFICVRSPVHIMTKDIIFVGMLLLKFLPVKLVDTMVVILSKLWHGDISKLGFQEPKQGPFFLKATTGRSPTIDVGCIDKVKSGEIKVFPSITSVEGNEIKFDNGEINHFDAIVFATGYRSTVKDWLKDEEHMFDEHGMPKARFPDHWKGNNGLYCAGFARKGLLGISIDAENIAKDISFIMNAKCKYN